MNRALIGFTGFVGNSLQKQTSFDAFYRSTNIQEIVGKEFDMVICAGAPAQKWIANREPEADKKTINFLIKNINTINCKRFVLISTVDVFPKPCSAISSILTGAAVRCTKRSFSVSAICISPHKLTMG